MREARNLKIALAYSSAFVARSDLVVIGAFSVLWGTLAGIDQGLSAADAVKRGSLLMVTANGAGLLWMPVMGLIVDRIDRVSALIFGAGMAAAAFLATMMIDSPLDSSSYFFFAMLGIGQVSCFFASQALVGQEAPMKERGSVIGVFGLCGAFGILLSTVIGGRLFDQWMAAGPFVLVGVGNLLVFIFAIFVRGR